MTDSFSIRPIERADEASWRQLWAAYLAFYESAVPDAVYASTFERLLGDDPWMPSAFVASLDGAADERRLVGLVHYLFHAHCWKEERVCYLQDLFTSREARGRGVGEALIARVYEAADTEGASGVYWLTQDFNATARRLYDRVARKSPFIRYERDPDKPLPPHGVDGRARRDR